MLLYPKSKYNGSLINYQPLSIFSQNLIWIRSELYQEIKHDINEHVFFEKCWLFRQKSDIITIFHWTRGAQNLVGESWLHFIHLGINEHKMFGFSLSETFRYTERRKYTKNFEPMIQIFREYKVFGASLPGNVQVMVFYIDLIIRKISKTGKPSQKMCILNSVFLVQKLLKLTQKSDKFDLLWFRQWIILT